MRNVLIAISVVVGLVVVTIIGNMWHYASYGARMDNQIPTSYENLQNERSQFGLQVREAVQTTSMAADDVERVVTSAIEARFGEDGSTAAFQWFQEQNPGLDSSLYTNLQDLIVTGRRDFQRQQTRFLDIKLSYDNQIDQPWSGFWLRLVGKPQINLDDYNIVVSREAREIFESGEDQEIQLRPDSN